MRCEAKQRVVTSPVTGPTLREHLANTRVGNPKKTRDEGEIEVEHAPAVHQPGGDEVPLTLLVGEQVPVVLLCDLGFRLLGLGV